MAAPNPNYTEILTTSIEARSEALADNVMDNNAVLTWMKQKGKIRTFSGGNKIIEELAYGENDNFMFYSGTDTLDVSASETITAAEFNIKQCAVAVLISGLEEMQNAGKAKMIELLSSRLQIAETTMANRLSLALYADGTGYGGKEITGLGAAVVADPTTGTYGNINGATYSWWRNQYTGNLGAQSS
ncbi:MAG TPA: phage major capsid protein, partial [Gemmatimonadales bacterium]|nr:phage major capsid protein [Gemmatimonadales bacterium]